MFFSSIKFEQALGVFEIMMEKEIPRTLNTYTALISCAEKTGNWEDALRLMVAFLSFLFFLYFLYFFHFPFPIPHSNTHLATLS